MHSRPPTSQPTGSPGAAVAWPVRSGPAPPLADGFTARPETMPGLRAALAPGAIVVLAPDRMRPSGGRDWLGSCGKTQLAVWAAEELRRSGGADLLAWITATSRASVLAGYVEASVAATGIPPAGDSESVASRFVQWLADSRRPWLVVFDDLTDSAHVGGLWPAGPAGTVLVTTADPAALPAPAARALVLPVGVFSTREALNYLMGRLTADPDQRLGGIDLVAELGGEPLALAQASAVIASSSLSCRDYQDQFTARREQIAGLSGPRPPAAAVSWTLSVDHADRLLPGGTTQYQLVLGALLDGHEIPGAVFISPAAREYLTSGGGAEVDARRAWEEILTLERTGLLTIDPGSARVVRISQALQAAVRAVVPGQMLEPAARAAAAALLEAWPAEEPLAWLAGGLRACAASLRAVAGDALWAGGCHPLLLRAGQSLDSGRLTGPAVAWWADLAATASRLLGPGHPDTLLVSERLASAYLAAGRPGEAAAAFRRALAGSARALGPDHPAVVGLRVSLGRALVAGGDPDEAVAVLADVVAARGRSLGADNPETLDARDELAAACRAAGKSGEAIDTYQRTLADRERVLGALHPDTIATRQKLGDTYLADGQGKAALTEHKRALADWERTAGRDAPETIAARTSLASAYYQAGRMASALQFFEQARADSERVLGVDQPDTLARRASLANTYYSVGRLTDARTLLQDTLERCERVLPAGDPLTEAVRESLARVAGR